MNGSQNLKTRQEILENILEAFGEAGFEGIKFQEYSGGIIGVLVGDINFIKSIKVIEKRDNLYVMYDAIPKTEPKEDYIL